MPATHVRRGQVTSAGSRWSLVALGDSVPSGASCNCHPYPTLLAQRIAKAKGQPVATLNDAVDGFTTADVLAQLNGDRRVIAHVRSADVITIEIGANDLSYSSQCDTEASCYQPSVPIMRKNLAAIMSRVHTLTAGRKVLIVLLDYWSIWLGGTYAAAMGAAYVTAADTLTDKVNAQIKAIAAATHSAYVDLRAAFKGPNYSDDETRFLSSDGDHPSARGHQLIASAAAKVIAKELNL